MAADGDERLIEEVKSRPVLYDVKRKDYRDVDTKNAAWIHVARAVDKDVEECKHRWKCLRERYVREKKASESRENQSGMPSERPWPLMNAMSFLKSVVVHRSLRMSKMPVISSIGGLIPVEITHSSLDPLAIGEVLHGGMSTSSGHGEGSGYSATMDSPLEDEPCLPLINSVGTSDSPCPSSSETSETGENGLRSGNPQPLVSTQLASHFMNANNRFYQPTPWKRHKPVTDQVDHVQEDLLDAIRMNRESIIDRRFERHDEDDLFCLSIAASLRRLPPQKKTRAKIKILEIFQDM